MQSLRASLVCMYTTCHTINFHSRSCVPACQNGIKPLSWRHHVKGQTNSSVGNLYSMRHAYLSTLFTCQCTGYRGPAILHLYLCSYSYFVTLVPGLFCLCLPSDQSTHPDDQTAFNTGLHRPESCLQPNTQYVYNKSGIQCF